MSLSQIYEDADKLNIIYKIADMDGVDALTIEMDKRYAVFVNTAAISSVAKLSEVVAHELGHCATGATHKLSGRWDLIQKHEHKANRWAFERYLPPERLKAAMHSGYTEAWQLAELMDFPESFIRAALIFYVNNKGINFNKTEEF